MLRQAISKGPAEVMQYKALEISWDELQPTYTSLLSQAKMLFTNYESLYIQLPP